MCGVNDAANTDGVRSKGGGELVNLLLAMRSRIWNVCVHGWVMGVAGGGGRRRDPKKDAW